MQKYKERKWSGEKGKKFGKVDDPYLPWGGRHEMAICTSCKAIYQNKRWFFDEELYRRHINRETTNRVICPACKKIQDHYFEGVLTLQGDFFNQHREEIITLLNREAERVSAKSPADRIIQMVEEDKERLIVETTTEKLAQRLGRAVYRAYKGELDFRWSHMNKFVRVYWSR
ncbi:MAG: ATPase [Deltaproteobacteria bacterium]|nr:ATPase [Deltaproteobacteria bacterium]MBW1951495.1 ATPase [Deltaproteobacteria bacterium]MBW1987415.1 ATPase [Deltaproteobacteria bacterium]MBW2135484.1 ATPase [Deltaproteobacteria bacterium]